MDSAKNSAVVNADSLALDVEADSAKVLPIVAMKASSFLTITLDGAGAMFRVDHRDGCDNEPKSWEPEPAPPAAPPSPAVPDKYSSIGSIHAR
jgi:hypothetical protein